MGLDIHYVAGLFDGEGWITFGKSHLKKRYQYAEGYVRYQLQVGIGMVYQPVILALQETFGGMVSLKRRSPGQSARTRTSHLWKLSSIPAAAFLEQVLPHLIVKRDEAEIAITFQAHIRSNTGEFRSRPELRGKLYAERDAFLDQLRALKRREFSPPVDGDPVPVAELGGQQG